LTRSPGFFGSELLFFFEAASGGGALFLGGGLLRGLLTLVLDLAGVFLPLAGDLLVAARPR